jgi:signal transduction histidine kinase
LKKDPTYKIAHDIKNPLGVISVYSELLLRSIESDKVDRARAIRQLEGIRRATDKIHELVLEMTAGSAPNENSAAVPDEA